MTSGSIRVLARDYIGNEGVDDGWLCDKGRFAYQAIHVDQRITRPLVREADELREVSWARAFETAAALAKHRGRIGAVVGGQASNEEGFLLQRMLRDGLSSHDIDSRQTPSSHPPKPIGAALAKALATPALQASVPDIEFAHTVLVIGSDLRDDAPILDLRVRKGVRRHGVKLLVASARPNALDPNAAVVARYAPGADHEFVAALHRGLDGEPNLGETIDELVAQLRDGGEDVVIIYGERIGAQAADGVLRLAQRLNVAHPGAGLLAIPGGANGRGLREAGCVPDALPGYAASTVPGRSTSEIAHALADGELTALYLLQADPIRDEPDRALWERALHSASVVVAHASVLTEGLKEHATVIFPAESHAEKNGTVTHPDGRIQRLRIAIAHPGEVRAGWSVLSELARRCGAANWVSRPPSRRSTSWLPRCRSTRGFRSMRSPGTASAGPSTTRPRRSGAVATAMPPIRATTLTSRPRTGGRARPRSSSRSAPTGRSGRRRRSRSPRRCSI